MIKLKFIFLVSVIFILCLIDFSATAAKKFENIIDVESFVNFEKKDTYGFCDKNWNNYKKISAKELREIPLSKRNSLSVDGRKNGGISVKGENRSDILIKACIRVWADNKETANSTLKSITISTNPVIEAENTPEKGWSVSYQVLVPKSTNLKLTAHNGGVSINNVVGNLEFETKNGGVALKRVGGNVKGFTKNGGVSVKLDGNKFNGSGLDVETKNGGISLSMPSNYSADIETGTVNGGLRSDFKELKLKKKGRWYKSKQISTSINGGGPKIRVVTKNGGVNIKSN